MTEFDPAQPQHITPYRLAVESLRRLFADEAVPLAGNIAFRTVFSVFPFLIFLTAIAGFFGTEDQARAAIDFLLGIAPEALVRPLSGEITSILTVPRTDLLSIAALITIWSAMAGIDSVRVGLNRAYGLKDTRKAWAVYGLDVLFVIGGAAVLLAFSFLMVLLPLGLNFAAEHGIETAGRFTVLEELRYVLAFALLVGALVAAHSILPAHRLPLLRILPGVVITVVVWVVLSAVFSWWLLNFRSFASTYASLSGIFAAMFFVYLSALALIFGGEVNRVLELVSQGKLKVQGAAGRLDETPRSSEPEA
jgi:membrane protein